MSKVRRGGVYSDIQLILTMCPLVQHKVMYEVHHIYDDCRGYPEEWWDTVEPCTTTKSVAPVSNIY